jgi:hypothetical protein
MAFVVSKTRSNQLNDVRNTLNTASSLILLFFQVQLQDFSRSESNLVLADVQESSQLMFSMKSATYGGRVSDFQLDDDL